MGGLSKLANRIYSGTDPARTEGLRLRDTFSRLSGRDWLREVCYQKLSQEFNEADLDYTMQRRFYGTFATFFGVLFGGMALGPGGMVVGGLAAPLLTLWAHTLQKVGHVNSVGEDDRRPGKTWRESEVWRTWKEKEACKILSQAWHGGNPDFGYHSPREYGYYFEITGGTKERMAYAQQYCRERTWPYVEARLHLLEMAEDVKEYEAAVTAMNGHFQQRGWTFYGDLPVGRGLAPLALPDRNGQISAFAEPKGTQSVVVPN